MTVPATIVILAITSLATSYAFIRPDIRELWMFKPRAILAHKEYYRMLTSGLIHLNWMHFLLNAWSFLIFGRLIEESYGAGAMLLIYVSSILGGSLLSLAIHRHHEYRALGASGGVCGIIFASIFLVPRGSIGMFFLPIAIPAYLYAILFLVLSYIGHRKNLGNIGHDAHLGGAIVGLLAATALYPELIFAQPWMFATVLCLSGGILWLLLADPLQLIKLPFEEKEVPAAGERLRRYQENNARNQKVAELDALLDKVARDGMDSLSKTQRERMENLSKEIYGRTRTCNAKPDATTK